jgi:hypothetical protein
MNATQIFETIRAAGGRLTLQADRIDIVCEPEVTAKVKAELAVDANGYGNLRAIVEEWASPVSAAEAIIRPVKKKKCSCKRCALGAFERSVLAALETYKNRSGTATPSLPMLVRDLGLQPAELPKVRAALASLEAAGIITIERRANTSNRYTFIDPIQKSETKVSSPESEEAPIAYGKEIGL